jgi:hypothetical protein
MKTLLLAFAIFASLVTQAQTLTDIDGDGIPNTSDNCILVANPTQVDDDTDAIGNDCDCAPLFANPIKDRPNLTFTYVQWYKNGIAVGTNSTTYSDSTLLNGDSISCALITNANCDTTIISVPGNTLHITVNPVTTALQNNNNSAAINLYPNPAHNKVYLHSTEPIQQIDLLNAIGQTVKKWTTPHSNLLDIHDLAKGLYTLKIQLEKETQTKRLHIE